MNDNAEIPQDDLISRVALKAKMFDIPKPKEGATFWAGVDTVGNLIDNAQAVDISGNEYFPFRTAYFYGVEAGRATARPKGEWIKIDEEWYDYKCSVCGEKVRRLYPFCHCGADMRKVVKNETV